MSDVHAAFLENPEAHADHMATCAECRAIFAQLNAPVTHGAVEVGHLPLAAWEGASYRSWAFVAICSAGLLAIAAALSVAAGLSPLRLLKADASIAQWKELLTVLSGALRRATLVWQIVFGVAFIAVNTLLVLLLRRPTRGIDA